MEDFNKSGKGLAAVCKWNEKQFGRTSTTSNDIEDHWFVLDVFDKTDYQDISETLNFYNSHSRNPVTIEIVDYYCLPGLEMVGICKTFWLKMIQRKWKKVFAERKSINMQRKKTNELLYRQRHGKWRENINYMPSLRGMLSC